MKKNSIVNLDSDKNAELVDKLKALMLTEPKPTKRISRAKPVVVVPEPVQPEVPDVSEASSSSDEEIEKKPARKSRAKPKEKVYDMGSPKAKKTPSEAQIRNLEKGRLRRDEIRKQRINERAEKEAEAKVELEQRIVKKAICIKKKQLKKEKVIELSSDDDDTPPPLKIRKNYSKKEVQQDFPAPPQRSQTIVYM
jgi:hypothetical protein